MTLTALSLVDPTGEVEESASRTSRALNLTLDLAVRALPPGVSEAMSLALETAREARRGGTDDGLVLGYRMAARHFAAGVSNRVILISDGVPKRGLSVDHESMLDVREERRKGIYLSCVGVGMGNRTDHLLEQLADQGDGPCIYIDRPDEATRVFVEEAVGMLESIARDVEIQSSSTRLTSFPIDSSAARIALSRTRLIGMTRSTPERSVRTTR